VSAVGQPLGRGGSCCFLGRSPESSCRSRWAWRSPSRSRGRSHCGLCRPSTSWISRRRDGPFPFPRTGLLLRTSDRNSPFRADDSWRGLGITICSSGDREFSRMSSASSRWAGRGLLSAASTSRLGTTNGATHWNHRWGGRVSCSSSGMRSPPGRRQDPDSPCDRTGRASPTRWCSMARSHGW